MESTEVALARDIMTLFERMEKGTALLKSLKTQYDARCAELQDYLVTNGKTSTGHIEGVGTFAIRRENFPSVSQERMPSFLEHLREVGDDKIIVETVPAQTLKKYCKDKIGELTESFVEDPDYASEVQAQLGVPLSEIVPPSELAKRYMEQYGVKTFQQIKLSITKKGK